MLVQSARTKENYASRERIASASGLAFISDVLNSARAMPACPPTHGAPEMKVGREYHRYLLHGDVHRPHTKRATLIVHGPHQGTTSLRP